ncbi:hypothetical protein BDR26DRAFT_871746 [Obelidium mucronatum]|nr:hypothetical protein BDR26DRAFT_871746 [Obelidium mucronatum]
MEERKASLVQLRRELAAPSIHSQCGIDIDFANETAQLALVAFALPPLPAVVGRSALDAAARDWSGGVARVLLALSSLSSLSSLSEPKHLADLVSALPLAISGAAPEDDERGIPRFDVLDIVERLATQGAEGAEARDLVHRWGLVAGHLARRVLESEGHSDSAYSHNQIQQAAQLMHAIFNTLGSEENLKNGFSPFLFEVDENGIFAEDRMWINTWWHFITGWMDSLGASPVNLANLLIALATTTHESESTTTTIRWEAVAAMASCIYYNNIQSEVKATSRSRNSKIYFAVVSHLCSAFFNTFVNEDSLPINLEDPEIFETVRTFTVCLFKNSSPAGGQDHVKQLLCVLEPIASRSTQVESMARVLGRFTATIWKDLKRHLFLRIPLEEGDSLPAMGTSESLQMRAQVDLLLGTVADGLSYGWLNVGPAGGNLRESFQDGVNDVWGNLGMDDLLVF